MRIRSGSVAPMQGWERFYLSPSWRRALGRRRHFRECIIKDWHMMSSCSASRLYWPLLFHLRCESPFIRTEIQHPAKHAMLLTFELALELNQPFRGCRLNVCITPESSVRIIIKNILYFSRSMLGHRMSIGCMEYNTPQHDLGFSDNLCSVHRLTCELLKLFLSFNARLRSWQLPWRKEHPSNFAFEGYG